MLLIIKYNLVKRYTSISTLRLLVEIVCINGRIGLERRGIFNARIYTQSMETIIADELIISHSRADNRLS